MDVIRVSEISMEICDYNYYLSKSSVTHFDTVVSTSFIFSNHYNLLYTDISSRVLCWI